MPLFDSVKKFKNQDYHKLKKECQAKGTLFIDTEFPPDERSLSSTPGKYGGVVWKRPKVSTVHEQMLGHQNAIFLWVDSDREVSRKIPM